MAAATALAPYQIRPCCTSPGSLYVSRIHGAWKFGCGAAVAVLIVTATPLPNFWTLGEPCGLDHMAPQVELVLSQGFTTPDLTYEYNAFKYKFSYYQWKLLCALKGTGRIPRLLLSVVAKYPHWHITCPSH